MAGRYPVLISANQINQHAATAAKEITMKPIIISASGLTGNIYAGHALRNKPVFAAGKQDVTIDALVAVVNHVIYFGAPVVISKADGTPEFEITVKKL